MSGRVRRGLGKGGAKRHRKVLKDNIEGITKPAILRLCRRGGVKRLSGLIYEETRGILKVFLEHVIRDSVTYTEHARRKTVQTVDVLRSLHRRGRTLYGFGVTTLYEFDMGRRSKHKSAIGPDGEKITTYPNGTTVTRKTYSDGKVERTTIYAKPKNRVKQIVEISDNRDETDEYIVVPNETTKIYVDETQETTTRYSNGMEETITIYANPEEDDVIQIIHKKYPSSADEDKRDVKIKTHVDGKEVTTTEYSNGIVETKTSYANPIDNVKQITYRKYPDSADITDVTIKTYENDDVETTTRYSNGKHDLLEETTKKYKDNFMFKSETSKKYVNGDVEIVKSYKGNNVITNTTKDLNGKMIYRTLTSPGGTIRSPGGTVRGPVRRS